VRVGCFSGLSLESMCLVGSGAVRETCLRIVAEKLSHFARQSSAIRVDLARLYSHRKAFSSDVRVILSAASKCLLFRQDAS